MKTAPAVIAIDGPASAGKSTLGKKLAGKLGYLFFDTGCLYRAVTLCALKREIPVTDSEAISSLTAALDIQVTQPEVQDGRQYTVIVDQIDITWDLRSPETDASVSIVSTFPQVRNILTQRMREIARAGSVVMVGRDIGTVVVPNAPLKIYLDAKIDERARRRHAEIITRGEHSDFEQVIGSMRSRDLTDSLRETAPLRAAADAHVIDTTGMEPDHVFTAIKNIVKKYRS